MNPAHLSRRVARGSGASLLAALTLSASAQAATEQYLANPRCESSAAGWTPSANATIVRATQTTTPTTSCLVKPKAAGTNTLTARSPLSPTTIARPGTRVHIASQVRATQTDKMLKIVLDEIAPDGTLVQSFTGQRPSSTTYAWVGAEFETQAAGSRIRVRYIGTALTGTNAFRFTNTTITVTPPVIPAACDLQNYANPSEGRLTFQDDFNGSAVDSTKWDVRDGEARAVDVSVNLARNVTVHDGLLDIAGKRENYGDRKWTAGYIDSIGKFAQKYGRWEIRAKIPTDTTMTRGVWPAFWLRGETMPGEIDVMEAYGSPSLRDQYDPGKRYEWTVWNRSSGPKEGKEKLSGSFTPPVRPGADFHTYAVQWSPECMVWSYDGQVTGIVRTEQKPWLTTSFDGPFNMRLNLQIGSEYWGYPSDAETKPLFNYLVDSVKVYEKLPG